MMDGAHDKPVPLIPLNQTDRNFLANALDLFREHYGHLWSAETKQSCERLLATMLRTDL